jgi:hypothetical protein
MLPVYLSELHSYSPCTDTLGGIFEHVPETICFSDGSIFLVKIKTCGLEATILKCWIIRISELADVGVKEFLL